MAHDDGLALYWVAALATSLAACVLPEVASQPTQTDVVDTPSVAVDAGAAPSGEQVSSVAVEAVDAGAPMAGAGGQPGTLAAAGSGGSMCACSAVDACCDGCNLLPEPTSSVFTDPGTRYQWERTSAFRDEWQAAYDHCEALHTCGYDDWKLPTVDMLRTIVQGCLPSQAGGSCKLMQGCLRIECADNCPHCPARKDDMGQLPYLLPSLRNAPPSLWSAGLPPDDPNAAWALDSSTGSFYRQSRGANGGVICVRGK